MQEQSKRFPYLVQSRGVLPEVYDSIVNDDADMLRLTFKSEIDGAIFFPKSSWTEGRNRLLSAAAERGGNYLYYIFLDEDVSFAKGDWRTFEQTLLKFQPAVATPFYPSYGPTAQGSLLENEAQTVHSFDAMFNAFHRDVIADGFLLPYHPGFDQESWWYSNLIVILLAQRLYPGRVVQLNTTWVNNLQHGTYPQEKAWNKVIEWVDDELVRSGDRRPRALARALRRARVSIANFVGEFPRLRRVAMGAVRLLQREPRFRAVTAPQGTVTHRLAPAHYQEVLRWDAPFWAARRELLSRRRAQ